MNDKLDCLGCIIDALMLVLVGIVAALIIMGATTEYDAGDYRAQGFVSGIVYAKQGEWAKIRLME